MNLVLIYEKRRLFKDLAIALVFSYYPFLLVCGVSSYILDALPHSCNSLAILGPSEQWPLLNLLPLK